MYLKYSRWPPWYEETAMPGRLLQRRGDDLLDRAVVAEMDDSTRRLQDCGA